MSPLPADNSTWPLPGHAGRYERMRLNAALYAGDAAMLRSVFATGGDVTRGGPGTSTNEPGVVKRVVAAIRNDGSFWGPRKEGEVDTRRHLPVPQDIATISSELLFAEAPSAHVVGRMVAVSDGAGNTVEEPDLPSRAAQQRLERVLKANNWDARLLEAGEISAALGSAALRITFDKALPGDIGTMPILAKVDADAAFPEYRWGHLVAITFWSVVKVDASTTWRLLERHSAGTIEYGLYKGQGDNLGKRQPLDALPSTAPLLLLVDKVTGVQTILDGATTAVSVPNMLPDPMDRNGNAGRSDYTPSSVELFVAIDRLFSQMMEEVDDARGKTYVADSVLERRGAGQGLGYDSTQKVYRINVPPSENESSALPIRTEQFAMRVEQYLTAIDALTVKAIQSCGFNAQTMGDDDGAAMTATEYRGKNKRSLSTRDKKMRYWQPMLERLLTSLLAIDVQEFAPFEIVDGTSVRVPALPVSVEFPEDVQPTLDELAGQAKTLREARGISTIEVVRLVRPGWEPKRQEEEALLIDAADQAVDPLTLGTAGLGV